MSVMNLIKATLLSSTKGKLGAMLIKDDMKKLKSFMDYSEYGGAPLLGVNGGVIKAHGSSDSKAIKNAINQGIKFTKANVVKEIEKFLEDNKAEDK